MSLLLGTRALASYLPSTSRRCFKLFTVTSTRGFIWQYHNASWALFETDNWVCDKRRWETAVGSIGSHVWTSESLKSQPRAFPRSLLKKTEKGTNTIITPFTMFVMEASRELHAGLIEVIMIPKVSSVSRWRVCVGVVGGLFKRCKAECDGVGGSSASRTRSKMGNNWPCRAKAKCQSSSSQPGTWKFCHLKKKKQIKHLNWDTSRREKCPN